MPDKKIKKAIGGEYFLVQERLKKKYPQVYDKRNWVKKLKKDVETELKMRKKLRSYGVSEKEITRVHGELKNNDG